MNALLQAATYGIAVEGSVIYCTTQPCVLCAKMIINAGITAIYITEGYPDELARNMLSEAGVKLIHLGKDDND
ncbi:MAG: cytidine deaminase, partial [Planctomycetes bacterium]|nr:cytidine deaminase [Planctomycetota bacterium]